jgi:hypothetical protein
MLRTSLAIAAIAFAAAAPAAGQVVNGGFEAGVGGTSSLTGYNGYGSSTASNWSTHNNAAGTTTTTRVASTDAIQPGGTFMLQIVAEQTDNGIFQYPIASFNYVSADFFVTSGVAQLIATNSSGYTQNLVHTTLLNQWQHIGFAYAAGNEIAIYSSGGGASFAVDNVVTSDVVPVLGVPEPSSWVLLIAGICLVGAARRWRDPARRQSTTL